MLFATARSSGSLLRPFLRLACYLCPLSMIPFDVYWIFKPGPISYYNHFIGLLLASCLAFTAIQLHLLERKHTTAYDTPPRRYATYIFWATVLISSLVCGTCYLVPMKLDCVTISWITVANAVLARVELKEISTRSREAQESVLIKQDDLDGGDSLQHLPRHKRWIYLGIRGLSRPLRPIYMIISILNGCGAVLMVVQQNYTNPGIHIKIQIPGHGTQRLNYYCNDRSLIDPRSKPTIWFQSTAQHGIVDFLGLQHHLALEHNFTSCSFDPPNFGWSWALPAGLQDHDTYLPSLVKALGREDEKRVHIGWGGGLKHAISNAVKDPDHTVAVVDLDANPVGIKYLDLQRQNGWDDAQLLRHREADLYQQVNKAMAMLTLGFGCGLASLIAPTPKNTTYWSPKLFASYRAQSLKDPYWTMKYYSLRHQIAYPEDEQSWTETVLPASIRFYAILNSNSVPEDPVSNEFYRHSKVKLARHIANDNVVMQEWCADPDCTALFPVDKAKWTADVIADMLGG